MTRASDGWGNEVSGGFYERSERGGDGAHHEFWVIRKLVLLLHFL